MNNMRKVLFLPVLILFLPGYVLAQNNSGVQDKLIGSTFKILAKSFVAVTDIDKLKEENIRKINKMDNDKFNKRYAKAYEVIKALPADIRVAYGIKEGMNKEAATGTIKLLNKDKIYKIIDTIPDKFIADQFRVYLSKKKQEIKNSNLVVQINMFWSNMMKGLKKSR